MGLAEKRALEEIKKNMPNWEKRIHAAAHTTLPIEVKWEGLIKDETGEYAVEAFEKIFVTSVEKGFKEICQDQIGKEAVAKDIKSIVMKNEKDIKYGEYWVEFKDGVLILDHSAVNIDSIDDRAHGLVKVLSKAL